MQDRNKLLLSCWLDLSSVERVSAYQMSISDMRWPYCTTVNRPEHKISFSHIILGLCELLPRHMMTDSWPFACRHRPGQDLIQCWTSLLRKISICIGSSGFWLMTSVSAVRTTLWSSRSIFEHVGWHITATDRQGPPHNLSEADVHDIGKLALCLDHFPIWCRLGEKLILLVVRRTVFCLPVQDLSIP